MAHREERGQALALMLVTIGLTLVGGVLVIDIGLLFDERRQVQAAADFAALAAAQDLPRNPADPDVVTKLSTAETTAHSYLEWNGYDEAEPDVSHVVTTTYTGEVDKIEVVVRSSRSWLFGGLFGLDDITVQGRAVAAANALQRDVVVTLDRSGSMCIDSHGSLMLTCGDINYTSENDAASGSSPNPVTDNISTNSDDLVIVGATAGNAGSYTANNGFALRTNQSVGGTMTFATASKLSSGGGETYSMTHSGPNRQQLAAMTLPNSGSPVTALGSWGTGLTGYAAPAGSDRFLVFVAGFDDEGGADLQWVRYGGQDLRLIEKADVGGNPEAGVEIWVLDDEDIAAAAGSAFTVSWDEGVSEVAYAAAFYGNVNQGYEPFDTMREAADAFTGNFEPFVDGLPFDQMALVSYSSDALVDLGLTTDYGVGSGFSSALWAMVPTGYTNIGHAIAVARQELVDNSTAGQVRVIVLLSDGEPNRYRTGGSDANPTFSTCSGGCSSAENYARDEAQLAADVGVAIYTIGLTASAGEDLLRDLATIGATSGAGGQYFDVDNPDDLNATFDQISELLNFALVE